MYGCSWACLITNTFPFGNFSLNANPLEASNIWLTKSGRLPRVDTPGFMTLTQQGHSDWNDITTAIVLISPLL